MQISPSLIIPNTSLHSPLLKTLTQLSGVPHPKTQTLSPGLGSSDGSSGIQIMDMWSPKKFEYETF